MGIILTVHRDLVLIGAHSARRLFGAFSNVLAPIGGHTERTLLPLAME